MSSGEREWRKKRRFEYLRCFLLFSIPRLFIFGGKVGISGVGGESADEHDDQICLGPLHTYIPCTFYVREMRMCILFSLQITSQVQTCTHLEKK